MPRENVFATCRSRWISCKIRNALGRYSNLNAVESFTKHDFDAEPYRTDKTGDDRGADPLHDPDGKRIGQRAGAADVDEGAQRQQRVGGDFAYAPLCPRFGKHLREVGSLERPHVIALPDMVITIRIKRVVGFAFVFQYGRKPWIVAPVGLDEDHACRLSDPEKIVDRVGLA